MKSSEIKIDTELNEALWKRGITKPPRRITVKMEKDEDGVVTISLPKEAKKTAPEPIETNEKSEAATLPASNSTTSETPPAPAAQKVADNQAPAPKKRAAKKSK
jgi:hypothetical protein